MSISTTPPPSPVRPPSRAAEAEPDTRPVFWALLAAMGSAIAMIVAATAVVVAMSLSDGDGTDGGAESAGARTIEVELTEFAVEPATIDVPAGTDLTLRVTNAGEMPHDLKLAGTEGTEMLDPGAMTTVDLGVIEASGQAWCTVPGHKEAGMVLDIRVTGEDDSAANAGESAAAAATIDFADEPDAEWEPYDPTLQPASGGTEHQITMHATETELEVAPGVTQTLWTFDGKVPGTTLRGKVGDLFTITLVNDGTIEHSIDFHASKVAWNDEMRSIAPGESLIYQFQAKHAGAFMYHCGTPPALHHIGNGMYGAIVIDPPDLTPVDHEYLLVQSELYLGPPGGAGDLTKMQDEAWDAVVFNGYVNQYAHAPIRVEPNQRIRVWVVDDGPSESSSFHVVGTIFDTVYKEGAYQLRPDASQGGAQALDLQPAQGGFVEFSFDEAGLYPIVTHKFANVGKGALGLFQAGDVEPTGGGH